MCTQQITYESSINLPLPIVSDGNAKIMWPFGGRCKSKTTQARGGFCRAGKLIRGGETALSCIFLFIFHICRKLFVNWSRAEICSWACALARSFYM